MVESLISEKGGKKSLRHDLESRHIAELDEFHKKSFFFQYLLSFTSKLRLWVPFFPKRKGKEKENVNSKLCRNFKKCNAPHPFFWKTSN